MEEVIRWTMDQLGPKMVTIVKTLAPVTMEQFNVLQPPVHNVQKQI
jgi:hypothetical protein